MFFPRCVFLPQSRKGRLGLAVSCLLLLGAAITLVLVLPSSSSSSSLNDLEGGQYASLPVCARLEEEWGRGEEGFMVVGLGR